MLIFIDLETSGLGTDDRIVSIGLIAVEKDETITKYELVNEGKKISSEASSVNHITNEMIQDKPGFLQSESYKFLQEHNLHSTILITHNAKFDIEKLSSSGFTFLGDVIDTLRVTKHLIPECESFSLQFLRYELKLYKKEYRELLNSGINYELFAHHALSDAFIVKLLYEYLLEDSSVEQMSELSFKNVLMQKFDFGKYKDRYIEEIAEIDRGYLNWMLLNIPDLDEDLKYSIHYHLDQ